MEQLSTSDNIIHLVVDEPLAAIPDGSRGWRIRPETPAQTEVSISASKLQREMKKFLEVVGELFEQAEQPRSTTVDTMQLDQIELAVEISAEGQVLLIGSGAKASGKGAIKLTFKRTKPS